MRTLIQPPTCITPFLNVMQDRTIYFGEVDNIFNLNNGTHCIIFFLYIFRTYSLSSSIPYSLHSTTRRFLPTPNAVKYQVNPSVILTSTKPGDPFFDLLTDNELNPEQRFPCVTMKRTDFDEASCRQKLYSLRVLGTSKHNI